MWYQSLVLQCLGLEFSIFIESGIQKGKLRKLASSWYWVCINPILCVEDMLPKRIYSGPSTKLWAAKLHIH